LAAKRGAARRVYAGLNKGEALDDTLLQYLSPLGWEHINLTGDYLWRSSAKVGAGSSGHATAATGLACFIFHFLRRPPYGSTLN
jgi:hypothetical protein